MSDRFYASPAYYYAYTFRRSAGRAREMAWRRLV